MIKIKIYESNFGYTVASLKDNATMTMYNNSDTAVWNGDVWDLLSDAIEGEGFQLIYGDHNATENCLSVWSVDDVMHCNVYQDSVLVIQMQCDLKKDDGSQYELEAGILSFIRNGLLRNITVSYAEEELKPAPCKVTFVGS